MTANWTLRQRWRYAIKPESWPKLLVPMLLGQAVGVFASGSMTLGPLLFGVLFTVLDGVFIVLLNDWSDQDVDRIKREMFPDGCSPKTIPDGILTPKTVLIAGLLAGLAAALAGVLFGRILDRPLLAAAAVGSLSIFVAYSLPPIKLNYRGGGEVLEAVGVGFALPWINAYAQSGEVWAPSYGLFAGFVLLSMASALASGLSDEVSDARGGKTTCATLWGNARVRRSVELLVPLALGCWFLASLAGGAPLWVVSAAAIATGLNLVRVVTASDHAVTNAFRAQKLYKLYLHRAIWYGGQVLAAGLLLHLAFV
jgi:1,4-dihydroxy-2-naphthoate octaprenyltransferase/chlorophyll synthase